jgi:hypothetical protein
MRQSKGHLTVENIKDSQLIQPQPSSGKNEKRVYAQYTCANCGVDSPECGFYKNPKLIRGHIPWCVSCHSKRTVSRRHEKNEGVVKIDGRKCRSRMSEEDRLQRNREKSSKHYHKNIEQKRKYAREWAKENRTPEQKRRAMLKTKYGLTPESWQDMFEAQGCKCAICESTDAGAKAGWNTDHCHKSGRVRFILCAHCNRGLGAFKDNPDVMRRAARMLEDLENQPDRPVEAIAR